MRPPFPTSRVELLTADGRFTAVEGAGGVPGLRPRLLLSRALCAFELFTPAPAARAEGLAAARLHARSAAPFEQAGSMVRRAGDRFAVWWWDIEALAPQLEARYGAARVAIAPETLAQPPGEGWRVVRLADGYEAQAWGDGQLIASAWRREKFDDDAWADFARVQRHAFGAPLSPPAAQALIAQPGLAFAAFGPADLGPGQSAALAAGIAALALASIAAFQVGQGLHHRANARAAEVATAALPATAPRLDPQARRQMARLEGLRALAARPDLTAATGIALQVVRRHGVRPDAVEADATGVVLTLPYAAIDRVEAIVAELEATAAFAAVRPSTQAGGKAVEVRLALKDTPP